MRAYFQRVYVHLLISNLYLLILKFRRWKHFIPSHFSLSHSTNAVWTVSTLDVICNVIPVTRVVVVSIYLNLISFSCWFVPWFFYVAWISIKQWYTENGIWTILTWCVYLLSSDSINLSHFRNPLLLSNSILEIHFWKYCCQLIAPKTIEIYCQRIDSL